MVGDKSTLDFEVTNNSELYDAEVSIECSATGTKADYYTITKNVASTIVAKTTEAGKVDVELIKATTEDITEEFTCTLTATATERTTLPDAGRVQKDPGRRTGRSSCRYLGGGFVWNR